MAGRWLASAASIRREGSGPARAWSVFGADPAERGSPAICVAWLPAAIVDPVPAQRMMASANPSCAASSLAALASLRLAASTSYFETPFGFVQVWPFFGWPHLPHLGLARGSPTAGSALRLPFAVVA
eukprot:1988084-Prymnesium_polylepis.1